MKNGVQEPPDDPRIYNRRQPDGSFRPLSGFFEPVDRDTTGEFERRFKDRIITTLLNSAHANLSYDTAELLSRTILAEHERCHGLYEGEQPARTHYGAHDFESDSDDPAKCAGQYGVLMCGLPESDPIHHYVEQPEGEWK